MAYVFISHAVEADGKFASRLARDLRAHNVRVWIAPDSIPGGENWGRHINEALETCDTMIVVQTPDAFASKWVETETFVAIDRYHSGEMTIIPIDAKECEPPALLRLHQGVSFRQNDYEAALAELLGKLGVSAERTSAKPAFDGTQLATDPQSTEEPSLNAARAGNLLLPDWVMLSAPVNIAKPMLDPVWPTREQFDWAKLPTLRRDIDANLPPVTTTPKRGPEWVELSAGTEDGASTPDNENPFAVSAYSLYSLHGLPRDMLAAAGAGDRAKEARDYAGAIQHYTKGVDSVKTEPTDDSGRSFLGSIYYRRGQCYERMDFIDSITAFDKAETATWQRALSLAAPQLRDFTRESNKSSAEADYEKARSLGYWFAPTS